jgi:hypothetical protein
MSDRTLTVSIILYLIIATFAFAHCHQRHPPIQEIREDQTRADLAAFVAGMFWPFYFLGVAAWPLTAPEVTP